MPRPRCSVCLLVPLLAAAAPGQSPARGAEEWRQDPYTKNDPAAPARAGYASLGPFTFGDDHDTAQIEHVLGGEAKLLWVETAHWKIGSALGPYRVPQDRDEKRKLRAELEALRAALPGVKPDARLLDRWLRLHLFARRLEDLYADLGRRLGVTDADFAAGAAPVRRRAMGQGPFLGQPGKFTVLLFDTQSHAGNYLRTFLRRDEGRTLRHNFVNTGSLLFVTCAEKAEGGVQPDVALHCEVVFHAVLNLLDGYRYYWYALPAWLPRGLAHWYLRRVSEKHNVFREARRFDNDPDMLWNWAPRVRARAEFDAYPTAAELLPWTDDDERTLVDAMMLWSRADYVLSLGDGGLRAFVDRMKDLVPAPGQPVTRDRVLAQQERALREAWGMDAAAFDRRWKAWVIESYPKK